MVLDKERIVKEMKVKCWCGIEGHLQQRGNSYRIQHYLEYVNGKRKYKYHRITREYIDSLEVNGSKRMEVKNSNLGSISESIGYFLLSLNEIVSSNR